MRTRHELHKAPPRHARVSSTCLIALLWFFANTAVPGATNAADLAYPDTGIADIRSFDVYADGGHVHLLVAGDAAEGKLVLRYLRSLDGGEHWSTPVTVDTSHTPLGVVKRGNDVQIAARGQRMVAVWHTPGTGFMGSGPLASAFSENGGESWLPGPNPADDGLGDGHAFIDIAADIDGLFHLVWLDNRERDEGVQGLRYARSSDGGASWSRNLTIDGTTCTCCWNSLAVSKDGMLNVLYRDDTPRDMALARSVDGGAPWRQRGAVGAFGWALDGCPHMGGALAAGPRATLHSLVWTGADAQAGLYYLRSADAGGTWSTPRRMGGRSAGHSDIASGPGSSVLAAWDENGAEGSAIFAGRSSDAGDTWADPERLSLPGSVATHPRIVSNAQGFWVLWTESAEGGRSTLTIARIR
ncbi:MAG: sialidase family protein [Gammaproteobacteria bacterium]